MRILFYRVTVRAHAFLLQQNYDSIVLYSTLYSNFIGAFVEMNLSVLLFERLIFANIPLPVLNSGKFKIENSDEVLPVAVKKWK